jgi:acetamidase/formamidase
MIDLIEENAGLSREDAYSLCSFGADRRVTQMGDIHNGIHCMLPKALLE